MKRGEELKSIQEVVTQPHMFTRECRNTRCEMFGVEIEVHGDDNRDTHMIQNTRIFSEHDGKILDRTMWCSKFTECEKCKCQTKETGCYATEAKDEEYWEERKSIGPMVVTPTMKSSGSYYKRWKSKEGGVQEFNPVSNTGGRGTREEAIEKVTGKKGDPMELDMSAAKRKVKKK